MAEPNRKPSLPVDALMPQVLDHLRRGQNLVLQAEPGAGKTTRVPPALLGIVGGDVLVLEPRRMAARMAARRVAYEMGEQAGGTVGYQVRFEEAVGPKTRLRFLTEGLLVRRLLSDTALRGVDAVVLDEFHERHLDTDLSLALLRHLQNTSRPDLKLIVMSATLDAEPVSRFLGGCPVINAPGRMYPLEIEHLPWSPEPMHVQVRQAVARVVDGFERPVGHTLIFLPGTAEIRRAMRACEAIARDAGWLRLPLYGDLSPEEQDRAVAPSAQPKLIFTTNVAESSVTVDGVTTVIDSGLARVAGHSPWTGLPTLEVRRISKASAKQRAGRAGRTGAGRVLRLYTGQDLQMRPEQDAPAILRSDLSGLALVLRSMGLELDRAQSLQESERDGGLVWLDAPPEEAVAQAEALLDRLGARGELAMQMARLPLPPRLARMVLAAAERGAGEQGCLAAAMLSERSGMQTGDLLEAMDVFRDQHQGPRTDPAVAASVRRSAHQLRRLLPAPGRRGEAATENEAGLLQALLAGFPDRVALRRSGRELLLSNGSSAELAGEPPAYEFMVALDAEDRGEKPLPLVRTTSRIEPEWLIDLFAEFVREVTTLRWNRMAERVEAATRMVYGDLLLQEWRDEQPDRKLAASMLAREALDAGIGGFVDAEAAENLLARANFAGLSAPNLAEALHELAAGLTSFSFAELRRAATGLLPLLEARMEALRLRELAPGTLRLNTGKQVRVHYGQDQAPWIEVRMQDFFGMEDGPRIGPERIAVVIHLLGPNGRAVQVTSDLRGFWQRLYPEVRRELMRRYPRHKWPERPV